MATVPLPERPDLDQLRTRARELQLGGRAGDREALELLGLDAADPALPLTTAQRVLARRYGFASWPRLKQHVEQLRSLTWSAGPAPDAESPADQFLRAACVDWTDGAVVAGAAAEVLAQHPSLPADSLAVASVVADASAVDAHLRAGADAAAPTAPFGWPPLMYLTYARFETGEQATLATASALLAAGADPNDGRYFQGYPTPFTVLTGVFGDGEGDQPRHRWSMPLARLLLAAGADPNDGQTLYNRQFGTDDDFLELLLEFGLGHGDGGPWRRRLPDLTPAPADLVRILLDWAVTHDQRDRVALLASHGVDVLSPLPAGPTRSGRTPIDEAVANGYVELAAFLRGVGAVESGTDPVATFLGAALAGDARVVRSTPPDVVAAARARRPGVLAWAAGLGRPEAVQVLLDAGFDIDALGRGDVPVQQPWQTALHTAVERDDAAMVRLLIERGADTSIRDARFDSTAAGWAEHLGRPHLVPLLDGDGAG